MVSLRYRIIVHFTLVSFLCEALWVGNVAFDGGPLIDARCLYRVSFFRVVFLFFSPAFYFPMFEQKKNTIYIFRAVGSCNNIGLLFFHFVRNGVTTTRLPSTVFISSVFQRHDYFFQRFHFILSEITAEFCAQFFRDKHTPTRRDY